MSEIDSRDEELKFILQLSPKIIQLISSRLYRSAASAIKELVVNSFDARASFAKISFDFGKTNDRYNLKALEVTDDGVGMTPEQMKRVFTNIGLSLKVSESSRDTDDIFDAITNRPVIGRLGIGMFSVASACRLFEVLTKTEESGNIYEAVVDMRNFEKVLAETEAIQSFNIGTVTIRKQSTPPPSAAGKKSFTVIRIKTFKKPFLKEISQRLEDSYFIKHKTSIENSKPDAPVPNSADLTQYFEEFVETHVNSRRYGTLAKLANLDQVLVQTALMCPVEYLPNGPVKRRYETHINEENRSYEVNGANNKWLEDIKKKLANYKFSLFVEIKIDGKIKNQFKLFQPLLYPSREDGQLNGEFLYPRIESLSYDDLYKREDGQNVNLELRGYFYHQNARILPYEFRGMLFRVYGVGIGNRFEDNLRLYVRSPIILHQSLIEVHVNKGFQSAVNLDRESFYESSEAYNAVRGYLSRELSPPVEEIEQPFVEQSPSQTITTLQSATVKAIEVEPTRQESIIHLVKDDQAKGINAKRRNKLNRINEVVKDPRFLRSLRTLGVDPETIQIEIDSSTSKEQPSIVRTKEKTKVIIPELRRGSMERWIQEAALILLIFEKPEFNKPQYNALKKQLLVALSSLNS